MFSIGWQEKKTLCHYSVKFRIRKNEQKSEMQIESPYIKCLNYVNIKIKMFQFSYICLRFSFTRNLVNLKTELEQNSGKHLLISLYYMFEACTLCVYLNRSNCSMSQMCFTKWGRRSNIQPLFLYISAKYNRIPTRMIVYLMTFSVSIRSMEIYISSGLFKTLQNWISGGLLQ